MLEKFKVLPMPLAQSKKQWKSKSTLEEILIITLCTNNETMVAI